MGYLAAAHTSQHGLMNMGGFTYTVTIVQNVLFLMIDINGEVVAGWFYDDWTLDYDVFDENIAPGTTFTLAANCCV